MISLQFTKDKTMPEFPKTDKNRVKRLPDRARYDRETVYQILDEALLCRVGFAADNQPYVIPINFARVENTIVLHGSKSSRLLRHIEAGNPVCVEATILDGLVLARSVFHSSVNYRSVVLFGTGRVVTDNAEKMSALEAITEHLIPGRWSEARLPTEKELNATLVVAIEIDSASAKVRSGPPGDDEADYALPIWAGVLPLEEKASAPIRDELMRMEIPAPDYVTKYSRKKK